MGRKLTPHRQTVLEIMRASLDHPTAREVYERSAKHSPRLSFATVYNALKHLTESGELRLIRFGDDAVRYDPLLDNHGHLVCRQCGRIDDALGTASPAIPEGLQGVNGFAIDEVTIHYVGVCGGCRKTKPRSEETRVAGSAPRLKKKTKPNPK